MVMKNIAISDNAGKGLAAGWGFVVWMVVALVSGRAEAWDSGLYFTAGLGLLAVWAGVIGFYCPRRAWRWGFFIAAGQFAGLFLTGLWAGNGLGLLPLGLAAMLIFNLPFCAVAMFGAFVRRVTARD